MRWRLVNVASNSRRLHLPCQALSQLFSVVTGSHVSYSST